MDVAAWLQGLGLERYAPAFFENRIEADILPSLTLEDLRDLGVTLVGDRRRLLDAIAALGVAISTPAASAPAVTAAAPAPAEAERRQLTVMFCDLVGSTALSTRFDPEDLRELIGTYHRAVADTVGRFDGFVAKYMGDGVLIYFGYPQAHEDDAEPMNLRISALLTSGKARWKPSIATKERVLVPASTIVLRIECTTATRPGSCATSSTTLSR